MAETAAAPGAAAEGAEWPWLPSLPLVVVVRGLGPARETDGRTDDGRAKGRETAQSRVLLCEIIPASLSPSAVKLFRFMMIVFGGTTEPNHCS